MNRSSYAIIASLIAMGSFRQKGSRATIDKLNERGDEWNRLFCHDNNPTYNFIGSIGYIQDVFTSMGFERSDNPDVLYSHLFLKDYEKEGNIYATTSGEGDNFFGLYNTLKEQKNPVFILGINTIGVSNPDILKFTKALSITIDGAYSAKESPYVQIYNPEYMVEESLLGLKYHVYQFSISAEDVGLPLPKSKMIYLVGFRAEKSGYVSQPMFPIPGEVSFGDDYEPVSAQSLIGKTQRNDLFYRIEEKTLSEILKPSYNAKILTLPLSGEEPIHIPYNYFNRGKVTSTYIQSNNNVRTLSLREVSLLHDVPVQIEKYAVQRLSFTRGIRSLLSLVKEQLVCPEGRSQMAESFINALDLLNKGYVDEQSIPKTVRIGGMFSGIGGFESGVMSGLLMRGIGSGVSWDYEINTYSQKVFSSHFSSAKPMGSIDNPQIPSNVDIVTMGFPCPDVSMAGSRLGIKQGTRSGLFIPAFEKCMQINPKFILMENVSGILIKDKRSGVTPIQVVLEAYNKAGWTVEWISTSSRDFGAPHLRKRWFGIAHKMNGSVLQSSGSMKPVSSGSLPKNGIMIGGKVFEISPDHPFDMKVRAKKSYPTPTYSDVYKRSTGGLRMLLQSGLRRSAGRDIDYPSPLPEGYKWIERAGKMIAREVSRDKFLNPRFVEWMMGFPPGWYMGSHGYPLNISDWSEEKYPKTVSKGTLSKIDKEGISAYGNAIMPHVPAYLVYAYLWKYLS